MVQTNRVDGAMPTTNLVRAICDEKNGQVSAIFLAIEEVANRGDCSFHQLLDMATSPALEDTEETPAYAEAFLWRDGGLIHKKFCELSFKEQIAAAHHVAKTYDHNGYEGDANTALSHFFLDWMKYPKNSQCHFLCEFLGNPPMWDEGEWVAFVDSFEFLAQKGGLLT